MLTDSLIYYVMKLFQSIAEISNIKMRKRAMILSKLCFQSYRSISNWSKFVLVFERIVFNAMYPFIRKRISPRQFDFTKRR